MERDVPEHANWCTKKRVPRFLFFEGLKDKKVIHREKRSRSLNEVKPVVNISKNLHIFLEISPM